MSRETEYYEKECPFCHIKHRKLKGCNIICYCNAKYYYCDRVWLDRKTGKEIWEDEQRAD